jgi:tryptophan halogenase
MAARHGRVLLRDEETARFGPTDYGYHLPARAYSALLKEIVCGTGVVVRQATSVAPSINDESGAIRSLLIGGEQLIEADLFVDASGPEAALIGRVGRQVEDWRDFFPFEHFSSSTSAAIEPTPVYADLRLSNEGWTELRASTTATHRVEGDRSGDGGDHESPGVRLGAWSANCVAVGSAACRLDPLFDLDLHALQVSLVQLISLFPRSADADADAERAEYNRATRSHFERIRDFQAALYHLAGFATQLPETLRQRLDAFRARGVIAPMEDETFTADQWRALFLGFGVMSESWPPAIDAVSPDVVKQAFRRTLGFVRDKVLAQPTHDELLATRSGPDAAQGDI